MRVSLCLGSHWGAVEDKTWEYRGEIFVLERSFWNRKRPGRCQQDQLWGIAVIWMRSEEGKIGISAMRTERSEQIWEIYEDTIEESIIVLRGLSHLNQAGGPGPVCYKALDSGHDMGIIFLLFKCNIMLNWIYFPALRMDPRHLLLNTSPKHSNSSTAKLLQLLSLDSPPIYASDAKTSPIFLTHWLPWPFIYLSLGNWRCWFA